MHGNGFKDLTGQTFGYLRAVSYAGTAGSWKRGIWNCECRCGARKQVIGMYLRSGSTTSCVCYKVEMIRKRCNLRPYESLYRLLSHVAARKNREVMSFEEFLTFVKQQNCLYCGEDVVWVRHGATGAAYNLDRRDNLRGYLKSNCVVCCGDCNKMKNAFTEIKFFEKICKIYRRKYER